MMLPLSTFPLVATTIIGVKLKTIQNMRLNRYLPKKYHICAKMFYKCGNYLAVNKDYIILQLLFMETFEHVRELYMTFSGLQSRPFEAVTSLEAL